jgi:hypothetical protein
MRIFPTTASLAVAALAATTVAVRLRKQLERPKRLSLRAERAPAAVDGNARAASVSDSLAECAFSELRVALSDRDGQPANGGNHVSSHALGSLVLLVDAFDAYLTEVLSFALPPGHRRARELQRFAARASTLRKYAEAPKRITGGRDLAVSEDLNAIVSLRHEIVHVLPTIPRTDAAVPARFSVLTERGVLMTEKTGPWARQISSYRLAYWAWGVIDAAVHDLAKAIGPEVPQATTLARNFQRYLMLPAPDRLVD